VRESVAVDRRPDFRVVGDSCNYVDDDFVLRLDRGFGGDPFPDTKDASPGGLTSQRGRVNKYERRSRRLSPSSTSSGGSVGMASGLQREPPGRRALAACRTFRPVGLLTLKATH
jgi:hypothetical protein